MRRTTLIAAGAAIAAVALTAAIPSIAASGGRQGPAKNLHATEQIPGGDPVCNFNGLTTPISQQVVTAVRTTSDPRTYDSQNWVNATCADLTLFVPRGKSNLVVATVSAEIGCYGETGTYCQGRILIDNVDSYPKAPEPSSFAWASSDPAAFDPNEGWMKWTSGTMTKSRIFTCPANYAETRCPIRVTPQVKLSGTKATSMWLDEIHTTVTATANS